MKLSINFAFAGIEIIKKQPVAVLLWGLLSLVISLATTVLLVSMAGPTLAEMQSYNTSPPSDPTAVFSAMGKLAPAWGICFLVSLLLTSVIQCAAFRTVLQPQALGFGFMRLGGDEVRLIVVTILWSLAFFVFYLLFAIVLGILMVVGAMVAQGNTVVGGIVMFALATVAIVAFLYVLCRWSLVVVQSFAEKKIDIFGSFKLTKGNGWTLFGGYLLLMLAILVVMVVIYGALYAVFMGTSGGWEQAIRKLSQPNMTSLSSLMTPMFIAQMLLGGVVSGAFYALVCGASAQAYRVLSSKETSSAAVF